MSGNTEIKVEVNQTKEIKAVDIVSSLDITDYILCIKKGKLCKIKVSDLKKSI